MEGVSRMGGVLVSGRILAVNIAKTKRMVGITFRLNRDRHQRTFHDLPARIIEASGPFVG